jgi:hypothetical protein
MSDSDFNTPPEFLDRVRQLAPDGIGLDPCSNATSLVAARVSYTIETNGLAHTWRRHGLVFQNPPHSKSPHNIEPWAEKAYREFVMQRGQSVHELLHDQFVGLWPAKTDTAWFQDHASQFPEKCFLRGRMKFWQNGRVTAGNGKFAHLVVYAGAQRALFRTLFEPLGWCP